MEKNEEQMSDTEPGPDTDTSDSEGSQNILEEFLCPCCYEIMIDPTTLTCGHNFCRHCLAKWYLSSKCQACPQCRQPWRGKPQVNRTLRTLIEASSGEAVTSRLNSMDKPDMRNLVAQFESHLGWVPARSTPNAFIDKVLAFLILQYIGGVLSPKPDSVGFISKWSVEEVSQWLVRDVGEWTEQVLVPTFRREEINGLLLITMKEGDFSDLVPHASELHKRGFFMALDLMRKLDFKVPSNLWEFKDLHLGFSVFLISVMRDNPRTAIIYLLIFQYHTVLLPVIHASTPVLEDIANINLYIAQFPSPTLYQWTVFTIKSVFCPHYIVLQMAYRVKGLVTWFFILLSILCHCFMELFRFKFALRNRCFLKLFHMKNFMYVLLIMICWPIIPRVLIDLYFNFMFYIGPILQAFAVYRKVKAALARVDVAAAGFH